MMKLPRTIDRSIARMIATKRIFTGTLALAAGVGLLTYAILHGRPPTPGLGLALLIFFGGGVWTLRDGFRLRRDLRSSGEGSTSRPQ